jgi:hypothetical protein
MRTARHAGGLAGLSTLSLGCGLEAQSWLLYRVDAAYRYLDYGSQGGKLVRYSCACVAGLEEGVWVLRLLLLVLPMWVLLRYLWLLALL